MKTKTRLERVHIDLSNVLRDMQLKTRLPKVEISRQIAKQFKARKTPKYRINYWPLANRVDEVY